nr:helix-turn-helix domain-containing protein [Ruegeria arenilitoris]
MFGGANSKLGCDKSPISLRCKGSGNWQTELDLHKRRVIKMLSAKEPVYKIATEIGRHRIAVYREVNRNRSNTHLV